jgi:subtilisin
MPMPQPEAKVPVFVIFKKKDLRQNSKVDKIRLFHKAVKRRVKFVEPGAAAGRALKDGRNIGLDFNRYHAPILFAELTGAEIEALEGHADVIEVAPDASFPFRSETVGNVQPPQAQHTPSGIKKVRAPKAWTLGRGKGVKIAVLDCGIDATHPDLEANYVDGVNCYDNLSMVLLSHATHCAGIAAAVDNKIGVVGVAPEAELYSVKVGQASGSVSALCSGIEWCIANDIDVISISREYSDSTQIQQVCEAAYEAGILIVASAGNVSEAVPDEETALLPAPARYPSVLAVSAISDDDSFPAYSGRGPKVELCAPGTAVSSTILRERYAKRSGTSMAAPHVAGAAAVVWSIFDGATNQQVRDILTQSARHIGKKGRNVRNGFGCVDVAAAAKLALKLKQLADSEHAEEKALKGAAARALRGPAKPGSRKALKARPGSASPRGR